MAIHQVRQLSFFVQGSLYTYDYVRTQTHNRENRRIETSANYLTT